MKSLWNKKTAARCKDEMDLLVYRSRLIGQEPKLCVWGGGNTSTKIIREDHTGRKRRVLLIKGSGSDLKTSTRQDFPPVDLQDLLHALQFESMSDEAMVDYVSRCLLEPKAPRPSIEVLLHAFVDQTHIDHTHADAILSITNTQHGKQIAQKIYGQDLIWIPYVKPGFTLAKWVAEAYQRHPDAKGLIMEKHGLITWASDAYTSYHLTIEMVTRAENYIAKARRRSMSFPRPPQILRRVRPLAEKRESRVIKKEKREWLIQNLPVIRKVLSGKTGVGARHASPLLVFNDSPEIMKFVNAKNTARVSQIGPATPDHMLRTRRIPLYIKVGAGLKPTPTIEKQIMQYASRHQRYFEKYKHLLPESARKMLDPYPKVILIPGIGMVTSGQDLKNAQVVSEIYEHSISVMTSAETIDTYASLSEKLAFEMDYWPMELYKLSLAHPEAEFSRMTGLVTGAGRGIGKAIAFKLAQAGAHVFLADIDEDKVREASDWIQRTCVGAGFKPAPTFPLRMDVTNPESVRKGFEQIILKCGGLDFLVSNAGLAHVASIEQLKLEDWEKSFAVNARGHFLVAREAFRILKKQGLGGAIVFVVTKNVPAPGKDFAAYSASKAAQAQLARVLAIEAGEFGIRVNMINPDGVFEDSGLWEKIIPSRAKSYGIAAAQLPEYYKNRNLMKIAVLPEDVAEAAAYLISRRSSKTTGVIIPVDGGVKEAFLR